MLVCGKCPSPIRIQVSIRSLKYTVCIQIFNHCSIFWYTNSQSQFMNGWNLYIVKSAMPLFVVVLSRVLLGEKQTMNVIIFFFFDESKIRISLYISSITNLSLSALLIDLLLSRADRVRSDNCNHNRVKFRSSRSDCCPVFHIRVLVDEHFLEESIKR